MVVSMFKMIFELPESGDKKDKRRIVHSLRDRLRIKFKIACAETDLLDSLRFAEIGGALVSNSKEFGESVMNKALAFVESDSVVKVHDVAVHSEEF
jgi:uncharacterized protein YlxP (DUF503 family)